MVTKIEKLAMNIMPLMFVNVVTMLVAVPS